MWNMQPLHARVSAKWRKKCSCIGRSEVDVENFAQLVLMPLRLLVNGVNLAMRDCGKYFDRAGNNLALTLFCGSARLSCPQPKRAAAPRQLPLRGAFFAPNGVLRTRSTNGGAMKNDPDLAISRNLWYWFGMSE
jgi:hypothetical protein